MKLLRHADAWNRGAIGLAASDFSDGLLFVMPSAAPWPVSMEGVDFPIDVYWLNVGGMVLEHAALFPGLTTEYWPDASAAYVLELPMQELPQYRVGDFVEIRDDQAAAP